MILTRIRLRLIMLPGQSTVPAANFASFACFLRVEMRPAFVIGNPIGFPGRTFCEIIWANWCLAVAALPMLVQSGKFGFEILSF